MTISIQSTSKSTAGNGSVTQFPYDFKIFKKEDLTVIIRAADGTETVLSQTNPVQYVVTGVGADAGGIVVINDTSLTPTGTTVLCIRTASFTQETDYTPNDPFPAADHENALDYLTMLVQQANEKADRSIKLSRTNTMNSTEFTKSPTDRANQILAFDSNGELSVEAGKIKTVTTTVSAVSPGGSPTGTSTYTQSTGDLALNFGIVTGDQGIQGIQGIQGEPPGLKYDFSSTTTDSDPGNGFLRANASGGGTGGGTSQLFISKTDKLGGNVAVFLNSWDDAGNASNVPQGTLQMISVDNTNKYCFYAIQGNVVDATNYVKVPISLISFNSSAANSGIFQAGEQVRLHFTRAGSNATLPTGSALAMAYLFG